MAHPRSLISPLGRLVTSSIATLRPETPQFATVPYQTIRCATTKAQPKKRKKSSNAFKKSNLKRAKQFALVDAMRYIRAFEVGRSPTSSKYEVHVSLRTLKNGPTVRNRISLPHPVKTGLKICVIASPTSQAAADARVAGAAFVGEDEVFDQLKNGIIEFDRYICHADSLSALNKAGVGRILGPKGLMPSVKAGTVVTQVEPHVRQMGGGGEYRERSGVVRMAIGQLGFTPEELQTNIRAFMELLKKDMARLSDRIKKEVHEVVLSSTNAPGFTLNGEVRMTNSISPKEISGPL